MKAVVAMLVLGVLTPMFQSVITSFIPARVCPDLPFLFVVALGVCWRSAASGMLMAALLGGVADLLSGALLGQHVLLRLLAFVASRLGNRRLDLRGAFPQAVFVAALTVVNAVSLGLLTVFFTSAHGVGVVVWRDLAPQAAINALAAPFVLAAARALMSRLSDDEVGRRFVSFEPRRYSA